MNNYLDYIENYFVHFIKVFKKGLCVGSQERTFKKGHNYATLISLVSLFFRKARAMLQTDVNCRKLAQGSTLATLYGTNTIYAS